MMPYRETPAPDASDIDANMRWLRDREQLKMLYQRYAYGVDTGDFEIVRSVFHPDCTVSGTLEDGAIDAYLEGIEAGLQQWTMRPQSWIRPSTSQAFAPCSTHSYWLTAGVSVGMNTQHSMPARAA